MAYVVHEGDADYGIAMNLLGLQELEQEYGLTNFISNISESQPRGRRENQVITSALPFFQLHSHTSLFLHLV